MDLIALYIDPVICSFRKYFEDGKVTDVDHFWCMFVIPNYEKIDKKDFLLRATTPFQLFIKSIGWDVPIEAEMVEVPNGTKYSFSFYGPNFKEKT